MKPDQVCPNQTPRELFERELDRELQAFMGLPANIGVEPARSNILAAFDQILTRAEARNAIPRCRILRVGTVRMGQPNDWIFDGDDNPDSVGVYISSDGPTLYGGWTVGELALIAEASSTAVAEAERRGQQQIIDMWCGSLPSPAAKALREFFAQPPKETNHEH